MRVCAEPSCPVLCQSTRCPDHTRARDKARGTAAERGYGAEHRAIRKRYAEYLASGVLLLCARCERPIDPAQPWDLGHDDHDRSKWAGPEHVGCNRATSGR